MKLAEFDSIRPFLPPDTEVTIITTQKTEPNDDEYWAVEVYDWGNHDGRFNVMCAACGDLFGYDIPRQFRAKYEEANVHKPCPKCGRTFIKKEEIKK